jgi:hypothetical protein
MDKKQIIGFLLIFAMLMAFTYLNQPSKEEIAKKRIQDSILLH